MSNQMFCLQSKICANISSFQTLISDHSIFRTPSTLIFCPQHTLPPRSQREKRSFLLQSVVGCTFQLPLLLPTHLKVALLDMGIQVIHILSNAQNLNTELFTLQLQANCQSASRMSRTSMMRSFCLTSTSRIGGLPSLMKRTKRRCFLSVANGDRVVTDNSSKESKIAERSDSDERSSVTNVPSSDSSEGNGEIQSKDEGGSVPKLSDVKNGSLASTNSKEEAPLADQKPALKRSPLTAREKLRAARVLSRYTESKASKPELGSKLLDALKESDKGKKRSGLPEAPTNLFDDSKRGMPKPGWTFEFPGGFDVFLVIFSFVFISTVMFATTYIVWKLGGIHFNEY